MDEIDAGIEAMEKEDQEFDKNLGNLDDLSNLDDLGKDDENMAEHVELSEEDLRELEGDDDLAELGDDAPGESAAAPELDEDADMGEDPTDEDLENLWKQEEAAKAKPAKATKAAEQPHSIEQMKAEVDTMTKQVLELKSQGKISEALATAKKMKEMKETIAKREQEVTPTKEHLKEKGQAVPVKASSTGKAPTNATPPSAAKAGKAPAKPETPATKAAGAKRPTPVSASSADNLTLETVNARLEQYKRACVKAGRDGRKNQARKYMDDMKVIKAVADEVAKGAKVPASKLPPALLSGQASLSNLNKSPKAAKAETDAPTVHTDTHSAPRGLEAKAGKNGLTTRQQLEYDDIVGKLSKSIQELAAQVKALTDEGSRVSKVTALQYHKLKKESITNRDLVIAAMNRGHRPPQYHWDNHKIDHVVSHADLDPEALELTIIGCKDLACKEATSNPNDLYPYVNFEFDWPSPGAAQKGQTSTVKAKSANPVFDHVAKLNLGKRSPINTRKFNTQKIALTVNHSRTLFSDICIGKAEVKLKELIERCEIKGSYKLKPAGGSPKCGTIEVSVRIASALGGHDIRHTEIPVFKIDQFYDGNDMGVNEPVSPPSTSKELHDFPTAEETKKHGGGHLATPATNAARRSSRETDKSHVGKPATKPATKPAAKPAKTPTGAGAAGAAPGAAGGAGAAKATGAAPASTAPNAASAAHPAHPAAVAAGEAKKPEAKAEAGVRASDLADPHNITLQSSNDVLDWEVKEMTAEIEKLKSVGQPVEEVEERKNAAEIQLAILVTQVQKEILSLPEYLDRLKKSIVYQKQLAVALAKADRKPDAQKVLHRVKIMEDELKGAEGAE